MSANLEAPRVICKCCGRRTEACIQCAALILREDRHDTRQPERCMMCDPGSWGCAGDPFSMEEG